MEKSDLLTDKQRVVIEKYLKRGSDGFSRAEYQSLRSVRRRCAEILRWHEEATRILTDLELSK